jgi:hypothetical protein
MDEFWLAIFFSTAMITAMILLGYVIAWFVANAWFDEP